MNWIVADLLMFTCSVGNYIAVRKATLDGLPSQFNNLAMFAIPMLIFFAIALINGDDFAITGSQALELIATAVVFSYAGNALSMHSVAVAPNPGYSLLLSKSYVVFTTIWAVVFFNSPITVRSTLAIVLIVASAALVMINRSPTTTNALRGSWLLPAIGAFFCWGFLSLVGKHLQSQGMSTAVFLSYLLLVGNLCIAVEMYVRRLHVGIIRQSLRPFVIIGIAATGFNFFNFYAMKVAPNVGYVNATNTASIGAVALAAYVLFGDELTKQKVVGMTGIFAGLLLLLL